MARIELKEPEAELHGTFAGLTYRIINGKQHVHMQLPDPLPPEPTPADIARHRKQKVVMWAVGSIQMMLFEQGQSKSVERMQELADKYDTFRHHAERKYKEWQKKFTDDKQLARAIAYWYITERFAPELFER